MNDLQAYTPERNIKQDDQLITLLKSRITLSETYRSAFESNWDKAYQYYRSYIEFDPEFWYRSQLFMPYIFAIIESITPDFAQAVVGGDTHFRVKATGNMRQGAQLMQETMLYQMEEKSDYYLKMVMFLKNMFIYGTSIMYTGWNKVKQQYKEREWIGSPALGIVAPVLMRKERYTKNDPYVETVYLKNFFPEPHKESIEKMNWCVERQFVDWEFILKLKQAESQGFTGFKNLDKIKENSPSEEYKKTMEEMNSLVGLSTKTEEDMINKPVILYKYTRKDRLIVMANKKVIIYDGENPFYHGEIPYTDAKDYPLDKEFYGMGDVDLLMPLQDKVNDMTNLRLDNLIQMVNKMWIADKHAKINPDDLISRPNGIVWTNDMNGIRELPQRDILPSSFQEVESEYKAMQRVSGAWDYFQGATPERKETATGIVKLQQSAFRRFGYRIKLFQRTALKRVLTQFMQLNQQLLPPEYTIERFDRDQTVMVNPWDIAGKMTMVVTGSSNLVNLEERMMMLWQNMNQDPLINQFELRKRLLDIMDIPDSDTLLQGADNLLGMAQQGIMAGNSPIEARQMLVNRLRGLV